MNETICWAYQRVSFWGFIVHCSRRPFPAPQTRDPALGHWGFAETCFHTHLPLALFEKNTPVSQPCSLQERTLAWGFQRMGPLSLKAGRSAKTGGRRAGAAANVTGAPASAAVSPAPASRWKEWPAASCRSVVKEIARNPP